MASVQGEAMHVEQFKQMTKWYQQSVGKDGLCKSDVGLCHQYIFMETYSLSHVPHKKKVQVDQTNTKKQDKLVGVEQCILEHGAIKLM